MVNGTGVKEDQVEAVHRILMVYQKNRIDKNAITLSRFIAGAGREAGNSNEITKADCKKL